MGNSGSRGGGGGGSGSSSSNTGSYTCKSQGGRSWKDNDGVTNICIRGSSIGNSGNDGSGSYPSGNSNSRGGEGRGGNSGSSSTNQESSSQNTYSSGDNYVIQELTTNLNKWQNLSYIDFSGKQLGDDSGKQFNEAFRDAKLPNLLTLVLTNNQIGDSGAQYLVQSLIHHYNNNLTTLILANNNLTNNGVTPFADGFNQINTTTLNGTISRGQITKLKTLDLRGNDKVCFIGKLYFFKNIANCKTKDTSILFDEFTIKTGNAHSLNLSNTLLSNDHYGFFSASFNSGYLSSLHTLVLSNNKMGDTGSVYLAKSLINHYCNNLTTLSLANNNLTNNGITPFADGLSSGKITKLKYLDLRENSKICFSGMLYFFKDIDKCKTKDTSILFDKVTINTGDIHSLGLNNKLLNDSHIPWITGAFNLKWLASIHNLNLGNNQIGDEGAKLLADSLLNGRFPHLKTLRLEGNKITDTGTGYLSKALDTVEQGLVIILKTVQNASKAAAQFAIKEMLHIAKSNGISTKEVLTTQETIELCKKGSWNVGKNIGYGMLKCFTNADKPIAVYEMDFQYLATTLTVNLMNPLKKPFQYYCMTESTVFSVVDEDFANCLTGLDSSLNDD
jgi:hypothetical protein